jgi:hypothetical protein
MPGLTIMVPLGALAKKRTLPEEEIEPLNVVPCNSTYCKLAVENEATVKVGTVVAKTDDSINDVNNKNANATINNSFFVFILSRN